MWKVITFIVLVAVFFIVSPVVLAQLTPLEELGKSLYFDDNLSTPSGMSCATCHAPEVGFTGPASDINLETSVYPGVVFTRFGNRKPPTAAYGGESPIFHYDPTEELYIGGMFWDGRATGSELGDPLAEQARGPFLNPLEMNNPTKQSVCIKVAFSDYAEIYEIAFEEPPLYQRKQNIIQTYDNIALAIAAYERSTEVNPFSSKFDTFWDDAKSSGLNVTEIDETNYTNYYNHGLTEDEVFGLAIFNDGNKGKCSLCHTLDEGSAGYPLFTDFSYDNLGIPKFPGNPFYTMPQKWNPAGEDWIDPGLGGFLKSEGESEEVYNAEWGKHKVPTLRNVDKRPFEEFVKAYGHNGYFKTLEEIVHFYNTRDVESWPPSEVGDNVNEVELGNLGLTSEEEAAIVTFMKTLSDENPSNSMTMSQPKSGTAGLKVAGPNPFNPETNFLYAVSEPDNIKIEVFNITGQRMAILVNEWKPAGDYPLKWYAAQYPSGIYFVRLSTSHDVLVKKVSLIK